MYSVSSQENPEHFSQSTRFAKSVFAVIGMFFIGIVSAWADQDATLVDEVDIPSNPAIVSGEVIVTSDESDSVAESIQDAMPEELPANSNFTEYKYGTSTVREYRVGDTLLYIEITRDDGTKYVINHTGSPDPESKRNRSGMVVMQW